MRLTSTDVDARPPPIIYHGPQNQTLPVNSVATLSCSASGEPAPVISWYRDQRIIPSRDRRFTILQSGALQITGIVITFSVRHSRGEMYWPSTALCVSVCLSVPRRIPTLLHGPGCNLRNGRGALELCTIGRICNGCTGFVAMIACTYVSL